MKCKQKEAEWSGYTVPNDRCREKHPDGWICTRPKEHTGAHHAHSSEQSISPKICRCVWGSQIGEGDI